MIFFHEVRSPGSLLPQAAAVLFAFSIMACATRPGAYQGIDAGVARGDFHGALQAQAAGQKKIYAENNAVSLYLDRGLLEHYAGLYPESSGDLEYAEELILDLYTKSITQAVTSYILNDNTRDYAGEDYEDVYINMFAALNYCHQGDAEGALVEIRKLTEKLAFLETKYAADVARMEDYADSKVSGSRAPQAPPAVNFYNSALARYLSGIFYRPGDPGNARVEFLELERAWRDAPSIYRGSVPGWLAMSGPAGRESNEELAVPRGQARLNILGFTGLGPVKVQETVRIFLPFRYVPDVNISLPALRNRPGTITGIDVTVEGGGLTESRHLSLDLLEDMGAVMMATFARHYGVTLVKTFVRTLVKYIVVETAGAAASKNADNELAGFMAARIAKLAVDASEQPDLRSSRYLPSLAWAGGLTLPPGEYTVTVRFLAGGHTAESFVLEHFPVREDRTNLVEAALLR